MLRAPLERAVSHYKDSCTLAKALTGPADPCATIDAFWEHHPDNWMTRQFCGRSCGLKARSARAAGGVDCWGDDTRCMRAGHAARSRERVCESSAPMP